MTIKERFEYLCGESSDINEHLNVLCELAKECETVTEFGVRTGVSTVALLNGCNKVTSYDFVKQPEVEEIEKMAKKEGKDFLFYEQDVLDVDIEDTDILFIDTFHIYDQLIVELNVHSDNVNKYIVLHDTHTFGEVGENPLNKGLRYAIEEFLEGNDYWEIKEVYENNNGLTVLQRKQ